MLVPVFFCLVHSWIVTLNNMRSYIYIYECSTSMSVLLLHFTYTSGQSVATSHDLTPKGS